MAINRNFLVKQGIQVGLTANAGSTWTSNLFISNKSDVVSPPSFSLDFTKGVIDPSVQNTRSSNATYVAANGSIVEVGALTPRLSWSISPSVCLGLLSEESRVNYVAYSDIEGSVGGFPRGMNAAGSFSEYPVVSNDVWIGPNKQSAKHTKGLTAGGDDNVGYMGSISPSIGSSYTASIYLYIPSTSTITYANMTWESGTVVLSPNPTASANMSIRDTWQRISTTCTMTGGSGFMVPVLRIGPNGGFCYSDCWQIEVGAYPTTWIPTTNVTSASRAEDINYVSPVSSFFKSSDGTMYAEVMPYWTGNASFTGTRYLMGFDEIQWQTNPVYSSLNTGFNGYALYLNPAATIFQFGIRDRYGSSIAGQETGSLTSTYIQSGSVYKFAGTMPSSTATRVALNGSTLSDSGATIYRAAFRVNRMYIGYGFTGGSGPYQLCGHVRKVAYYPRILSAAELAALTET